MLRLSLLLFLGSPSLGSPSPSRGPSPVRLVSIPGPSVGSPQRRSRLCSTSVCSTSVCSTSVCSTSVGSTSVGLGLLGKEENADPFCFAHDLLENKVCASESPGHESEEEPVLDSSSVVELPAALVPDHDTDEEDVVMDEDAPRHSGAIVDETELAAGAPVPKLVSDGPAFVPELVSDGPAPVPELVSDGPAPVPELVSGEPAPVPELVSDGPAPGAQRPQRRSSRTVLDDAQQILQQMQVLKTAGDERMERFKNAMYGNLVCDVAEELNSFAQFLERIPREDRNMLTRAKTIWLAASQHMIKLQVGHFYTPAFLLTCLVGEGSVFFFR